MTEDQDPVSVTRSEERLRADTRRVAVGRAVLRRTVVVEERTITVQVRHEEAHLEVVPFDEPHPLDDERGGAHAALPEFLLHREEIVVTKRLVPVERVGLRVDRVAETERVVEEVRVERIEVTGSPDVDLGEAPEAG